MPQQKYREAAQTETWTPKLKWQATSAIPGRIRLQVSNSSVVKSALLACATRIASDVAVTSAMVIPEARSVVVVYEPSTRSLAQMVRDALSAAQGSTVAGSGERAIVVAPIAGRPSLNGSSPAAAALARPPGNLRLIRAMDHPARKSVFEPIVLPTAAMIVATLEFIPVAVTIAAIAIAALPIARRTVIGIRKRQLVSESMDLMNIVLVIFEGTIFQASLISWLVQIGDFIRVETMHKARKRLHASAEIAEDEDGGPKKHKTVMTLEEAPLGDSEHQHGWTKKKNSFSIPLAALALTAFGITRDPGYLIGLTRPQTDFNTALCFGVPGPLLAAMSRSAAHGPLIRSGAAVERLARIDAIVFASVGTNHDEHLLGRHVRPLMKRGIHRFILPTEKEAAAVRRTAVRAGIVGVVAEPMPEDRHSVIRMLVRHGHHVALIDDGLHSLEDIAHADVHVVIDGGQTIPDSAHVVLAHANLHGLVHAIDASREAVRKIRHNTILAASAAGVNLMLSLVPPVAATAVNTAVTAIVSVNSLRSDNKKISKPQEMSPPGEQEA